MTKYKIVFASSSPIGIPALKSLISDPRFFVSLVLTGEDKKIGRNQVLSSNEIKKISIENQTNFFHPKDKKEIREVLEKEKPDFFLVIAFGMIIGEKALMIPKFSINIHGSILPKYRGASPIQESILNGDKETGISIMEIVKKMDSGGVFKVLNCKIEKFDNKDTIFEKLGNLGANISDILEEIFIGKLKKIDQNDDLATYTKKINKEDGQVFFQKENAERIFNKFRAYFGWPGIYTFFEGKILKFIDIDFQENEKFFDEGDQLKFFFGKVFKENGKIFIKGKGGNIEIKTLQLEGKKIMNIKDFLNGNKNFLNYIFD